jgi:hypothetical protein
MRIIVSVDIIGEVLIHSLPTGEFLKSFQLENLKDDLVI